MYTNGHSSHDALNWEQFTYTFTATKATTSIEFQNFTIPNEDYIGLDDANLVDLSPRSATPEPATLSLAGMTLLVAWWRKRIGRSGREEGA